MPSTARRLWLKWRRLLRIGRDVASFSACGDDDGPCIGENPFEGMYEGIYSGDDFGEFEATVDSCGQVTGEAFSLVEDESYGISGDVSEEGDLVFIAGSVSSGATFSGTIDQTGFLQGTWSNRPASPAASAAARWETAPLSPCPS
jgi:hypothetical protein